jgi:isopentenyldiphosphate isomerase
VGTILAFGEKYKKMKEKIIIVNEKDEIINHKERGTLDLENIYRVSALWIMNSKGDVLLAQRSFTKKNSPGKWGPAVAGTNDIGETYLSNIIKETKEEIGIEIKNPKPLFKKRSSVKHNYFVQWFFAIIDKEINEFTIQKEEVEKIKWVSKKGFLEEMKNPNSEMLESMRVNKDLIKLVEKFK